MFHKVITFTSIWPYHSPQNSQIDSICSQPYHGGKLILVNVDGSTVALSAVVTNKTGNRKHVIISFLLPLF